MNFALSKKILTIAKLHIIQSILSKSILISIDRFVIEIITQLSMS